MSNTISVIQAAKAARQADIRRQEEAARHARIERERSAQARGQILQEDERFRRIQSRRDEAAARLPDLVIVDSFSWTEVPVEEAGAARLETYLAQVRQGLDRFDNEVTNAIRQAEYRLQRSKDTAAAWRTAQDAEAQWRMNHQTQVELSRRLAQGPFTVTQPTRPDKKAELELVQDFVARLQSAIARQELALAAMRVEARNANRAAQTAGNAISGARSGEKALAEFNAAQVAMARARFDASLLHAMTTHQLHADDLPPGMQRLIKGARHLADEKDWAVSLGDWMAREATRRRDTSRALGMLVTPPEGALEDPALAQRWLQLTPRLQAVMAGHEPMTSDIEAEFEQLGRDAQRQLNHRLSRAACHAQLAQQGMEVLACEDGRELIEIDLHTWLELEEYEGENGEYAATFVLKTDAAEGAPDDEAKTAAVCDQLAKAAGQQIAKVNSDSEVVERKSRITRGRKPTLKSRAMKF
jgi:hypothetical protein